MERVGLVELQAFLVNQDFLEHLGFQALQDLVEQVGVPAPPCW